MPEALMLVNDEKHHPHSSRSTKLLGKSRCRVCSKLCILSAASIAICRKLAISMFLWDITACKRASCSAASSSFSLICDTSCTTTSTTRAPLASFMPVPTFPSSLWSTLLVALLPRPCPVPGTWGGARSLLILFRTRFNYISDIFGGCSPRLSR